MPNRSARKPGHFGLKCILENCFRMLSGRRPARTSSNWDNDPISWATETLAGALPQPGVARPPRLLALVALIGRYSGVRPCPEEVTGQTAALGGAKWPVDPSRPRRAFECPDPAVERFLIDPTVDGDNPATEAILRSDHRGCEARIHAAAWLRSACANGSPLHPVRLDGEHEQVHFASGRETFSPASRGQSVAYSALIATSETGFHSRLLAPPGVT